ncbi:MAG: cupin domain-containing protein [Thermoplasmata archaeon]|nr:cupin domain-containing protein [Thermoplasmata archaeon]
MDASSIAPKGMKSLKEKNLQRIAKKNGIQEEIIVDVVDEDISNVDSIAENEMEEYNREYEEFLKKGKASVPFYPIDKVMVANIQDYLKFSKDNAPSVVYYSDNLKIPLLTLRKGGRVKPNTDSTGVYYIIDGKGIMKIGMKNYTISKGSLIHVPKGVVHSIESDDTLTLMAIHIS